MKLDRNTNRGGHGKYALVNMRKLVPILEAHPVDKLRTQEESEICSAFALLLKKGIITLGKASAAVIRTNHPALFHEMD